MDTHIASLARICALGYSERESRFLALAATHGGYFLGRQVLAALGTTKGRLLVDFIARLRERRHATVQTFCRATRVYHLTSAVLDAARTESRSQRRRRPVLAIKRRLMEFDLGLTRPDIELLHSAADVHSACTRLSLTPYATCAVTTAALGRRPTTPTASGPWGPGAPSLPSPRDTASSPRKPPLTPPSDGAEQQLVSHQADLFALQVMQYSAPRLVCIYIDDGARSLAGFRSFLRRQWPLLATIPDVAVAYVGEIRERAEDAATCVRRTLRECQRAAAMGERATVFEYFDLRQKVQEKRWDEVGSARLERYFDLRQHYGEALDEDYARWLRGGEVALLAEANPAAPIDIPLVPIVLPYSYLAVTGTRRRTP